MDELQIKQMANAILDNEEIECEYIEYKKSFESVHWDSILKTACAFSNNYMENEIGLIFIGVEETNDKITGNKAKPVIPINGIPAEQIETITGKIKSLIYTGHLSAKVDAEIFSNIHGGKHYIVIAIMQGSKLCQITEKGINYVVSNLPSREAKQIALESTAYVRIERSTVKANFNQIERLKRKFARYSFLSDINDSAVLSDLSIAHMQEYCIRFGKPKSFLKMTLEELAENLGIIKPIKIGSEPKVTNFGVLMFAPNPEKFIEGAFIHILKEVGDKNPKRYPLDIKGPIWVQLQKVWEYFDSDVIKSCFTKPGWQSHTVFNYPQKALREAAANCVFHKAYDSFREIEIYITDKDICFTNYNRPLLPITIDQLNTKDRIRAKSYLNNELKEPLKMLKFIEKEGTGIQDIKESLRDNNNPAIQYDSDGDEKDFTSATIYSNEEFVKLTEETNKNNSVSSDKEIKLPKNQKVVYDVIRKNPGLRIPAISSICGLKETSTDNSVRKLKEKGLIEYIGTSKDGGYYQKSTD